MTRTLRVLAGSTLAGLLLLSGWSSVFSADKPAPSSDASQALEKAIFAGGCFWCMEPPYDKLDGVISTVSGYTGGQLDDPSYKQVSAGVTGHTEAIEITYDPNRIGYRQLLEVFWRNIDPTVKDRQFCDTGSQYRSGIFYLSETQRELAVASLRELEKNKPFAEPIVAEITRAGVFYPAEEYHQDYYQKNPLRYKYYRYSCGRDQRLEKLWGPMSG